MRIYHQSAWKRVTGVLFDLPAKVWYGEMEFSAQVVRTAIAEEEWSQFKYA